MAHTTPFPDLLTMATPGTTPQAVLATTETPVYSKEQEVVHPPLFVLPRTLPAFSIADNATALSMTFNDACEMLREIKGPAAIYFKVCTGHFDACTGRRLVRTTGWLVAGVFCTRGRRKAGITSTSSP